MNAPARPGEADRDAIETQLLQLVSPHSRVLVIGRDTWPLSRTLSSAGCRVSVVETRHDAPAGSATFSDRVIVGDPDALNLNATLDGAQFDAIVAVRLLEHVRNPVGMLTALGKHLSADGGIVAAVPNVMHGENPARVSRRPVAGRPAVSGRDIAIALVRRCGPAAHVRACGFRHHQDRAAHRSVRSRCPAAERHAIATGAGRRVDARRRRHDPDLRGPGAPLPAGGPRASRDARA